MRLQWSNQLLEETLCYDGLREILMSYSYTINTIKIQYGAIFGRTIRTCALVGIYTSGNRMQCEKMISCPE